MIGLSIIQNDKTFDISQLVNEITWSGRKGAAGRKLSAVLLDDPEYERAGIDVEQGCRCIFSWNKKELFRGIVMRQSGSYSKTMPILAYDNLIYFANNDDTFTYSDCTASYIFLDLCKRYQVAYDKSNVADTGYIIPSISQEVSTPFDILLKALSNTYSATGNRFYPGSEKGLLYLLKRKEQLLQWVIEVGINLINYDYTKSIEEIATRIKMVNEDGSVVAEAVDSALEKKVGIFGKVIRQDKDMNTGKLTEITKNELKLKSKSSETLNVTGTGVETAITGKAVFIKIPHLSIKNSYYIDEDTHTFRGEYHEMSLSLNKTLDF